MNASAQSRLSPAWTYLSYVSPLLLRRAASPAPLDLPHVQQIPGTVALIDIERFSSFAERMARRGGDGMEQLSVRINDTFAVIVESIERYGGTAHSFPGDSVIAVWPAESRSMEDAALLATRCALELLELYRESELPLKAGLASGTVRVAHVGGCDGRLQGLLSGEPLDRMGRAEERASRGRLIAAEETWRLVAPHADAESSADGFYEIRSLRSAPPPAASSDRLPDAADGGLVDRVCAYLPLALVRQLDAGHGQWLGEFRDTSIAFIQIGITAGARDDSAAQVHAAFGEVQRVLFRHGGDITRFGHDDKGLSVLAVFGLPPASSEEMARRAVQAALEVDRSAPAHGFHCRIGIGTGRVFCGTLGAPRRREFSVVGSTPNLAARLMQSVESGVLVDSATMLAASGVCRFENAGRLRPKGFSDAVEVYRAASTSSAAPVPAVVRDERPGLIGREPDRQRLLAWIERLRQVPGAIGVVQGEAGVGKSALVSAGVAYARSADFEVVHAACDAIETSSAYVAWGKILAALLHLQAADTEAEKIAILTAVLSAAGVPDVFAPLVAPVIGLPMEQNETTLEMSGSARGESLLALLARLLSHLARQMHEARRIVLVVLEDVHWLDPSSWELLGVLARRLDATPLGVLMTVRSESTPPGTEWQEIVTSPHCERFQLTALTQADTRALALRLLHAEHMSQQLQHLVYERTHGNPFFCEQLVSALAESGVITVDRGVASLRIRNPEEAERLVPHSVAAVVTSRLDRLPAPVQLTLKTASVIGTHFALSLLASIHPMHVDGDALLAHLGNAIELGLVERDELHPGMLAFRHAITADVAYGMLLVSQRRELHRAVAEGLRSDDASPGAQAALFYHWRHSGDEVRALQYVDRAGAEAMRNGNYHAVTELYGYALQTIASHPDSAPAADADTSREARWSGHLGEAQVALGLHEAARSNLELCLESLGEHTPGVLPVLGAAIVRESARQLYHRLFPRRTEAARASEAANLALAAGTYEQLGYVYYSAGETARGLFAALRILNLAELAGLPDLMARSYAVMSLTASVVGLRRLAALYDRRALRLARETDDLLAQAYVGWITGVRAAGEALWPLVTMRVEPARRIAEQVGDRRLQIMSLQTLAWPPYVEGDTNRTTELAQMQLALARESNNRLWEAWGLNGLSEACVMAGDYSTAVRNSQRALEVLSEESDKSEEGRALGLLAFSLYRLQRSDEALSAARRGVELIRSTEMTNFSMYEAFAGTCEVFVSLAEETAARGRTVPTTLRTDARRATDAFARFAKVFALGRPRLHVIRARLAALAGSHKDAEREFHRALRAADDLAMPNEKGLALLASARCLALSPDARRRRAEEAVGLLRTGEALRQAQALLQQRSA